MAGITITYTIAMAAGRDAGNRSMRKGGRTAWSEDDASVAAGRVEQLATALYKANHPAESKMGVPLEWALLELQDTRGMSCIVEGLTDEAR